MYGSSEHYISLSWLICLWSIKSSGSHIQTIHSYNVYCRLLTKTQRELGRKCAFTHLLDFSRVCIKFSVCSSLSFHFFRLEKLAVKASSFSSSFYFSYLFVFYFLTPPPNPPTHTHTAPPLTAHRAGGSSEREAASQSDGRTFWFSCLRLESLPHISGVGGVEGGAGSGERDVIAV